MLCQGGGCSLSAPVALCSLVNGFATLCDGRAAIALGWVPCSGQDTLKSPGCLWEPGAR